MKSPYTIELAGGMQPNFPFSSVASNNTEQSLRKVQSKRIDACIFGDDVDGILKQTKLDAIHREQYGTFMNVFITPKGPKSAEIDRILSDCLRKLKASGYRVAR